MSSKSLNIRLGFEITEKSEETVLPLKNDFIDLLDAIKNAGSISAGAKKLGYSYRHVWNELKSWEAEFGRPLLERGRGKNSELSEFAEKLLWANKEVQAKYKEQIADLQAGISQSFRKAFQDSWDPVTIEGCGDSALNMLRELPDAREVEVNFTTSRNGLEAMSAGKCDVAGFNFPVGSTKDSEAFRTFGSLLPADEIRLISFATRLQGLVTQKGNPKKIYSVLDIACKKAKFVNRRTGTGTRILFDQVLKASGMEPQEIIGYDDISDSQFLTAVQVASGKADVGVCTENVAKESPLEFIPLVKEVYFLACKKEFLDTAKGQEFIAFLKNIDWDNYKEKLSGYDFKNIGEIRTVNEVFG